MRKIFSCLIVMLFCVGFIYGQKKTGSARYTGSPETDKAFTTFISRNLGRVVYLNLTIRDTGWITDGYRGVQSYFEGAKTNGISYSYFLECDDGRDDTESAISECGNAVNWAETTGKLSGHFKVARISKTGVRNYRAVFLVPVKN
jgi:hypothetical protein